MVNYSCNPGNLDLMYNSFENDVVEIMNKHAPFKQANRKPVQLPYMNKELRKAIYTRKCLITSILKRTFRIPGTVS